MDEPRTSVADLAAQATHLSPVLGRYFERSWSHGKGHRLYDTDGRAYLDFANGIAVTALGHAHPRVTAAIHAQADRLIGPTGAMGFSEPVVRLASMLAATFPDPIDTVMFLNSGSEAIDGALKLARRVTGRPGIVAFRGGFHGRTFGATSVTTSNINYRTGYEPLLPGVHFAPFPAAYRDFAGDEDAATISCLRALTELFETVIAPQQVAAILIEPVQGEGGYTPAPVAFLQGLRGLCDEHGILLIADEVQSGFGRTGKLFAMEHSGVIPDLMTMAKSLGGGYPLSAVTGRAEIMDAPAPGGLGGTYAGNPIALAAAEAVLDVLAEEKLCERATALGARLRGLLERLAGEIPAIAEVRGLGGMIAVELMKPGTREPDPELTRRVQRRALDAGLILLTAGMYNNVIRFLFPLTIEDAVFDAGLRALEAALRGGVTELLISRGESG
jgi:4-aminobutyrate aminotransferase